MTDEQLKKACIFDLTDDPKILRQIASAWPQPGHMSREKYLSVIAPETRFFDMFKYAESIVKNKELTEQLNRVFKEELSAFFCE